MRSTLVISLIFVIATQLPVLEASCYFPLEYQGEFLMQSPPSGDNVVQYSTLNITENSIPIWGNCHRRFGNNFILNVNIGETNCIRCIHLKLRSSNVLQVFIPSQQAISQCSTNEESAELNCPKEDSLYLYNTTAQILFFKIRDATGKETVKEYCPIDGKYSLRYISRGNDACDNYNSSVDTCPSGSKLNFRLRGCNFNNTEVRFDCLAHWKSHDDENYLIFTDSRRKPKYRCAKYKQNSQTGVIQMTASSDSTCTNDLINSTNGFETFELIPKSENSWPAEAAFSMCNFPKWMQGNWEHVRVDGHTLVYKDHSSLKTYVIKCIVEQEANSKYLVFSRTQCDEESYNCLHIAKRSSQILEFQLGRNSRNSSDNKDFFDICSEVNFDDDSWITQARLDAPEEIKPGMCPITGEYIGIIPDDSDLCAKLWSDCRAPELMYYQVSHCESKEVYEEREYKCLGHWRDAELLYTYTQRQDIAAGTYECFVGSIISENEINIKEAGGHCQRHINPLLYGMKLMKRALYSCISRDNMPRMSTETKSTTPSAPTTFVPSSAPTRRTTMRQWNFDNTIPEIAENTGTTLQITTILYIIFLLLQLNNM